MASRQTKKSGLEDFTFEQIKEEYVRRREEERKNLSKYLEEHKGILEAGLSVVTRGRAGKGLPNYKSGGGLPRPYDLKNWKWVGVKGPDGFSAAVSLNMPDIDPDSKNIHGLYDRIGIVFSCNTKWPHRESHPYGMIALPMDQTEDPPVRRVFRTNMSLTFTPDEWVYTDIDLPLDEEDKERIARLILERYRAEQTP